MAAILNGHQVPDSSILDLHGKQTYLGNSFVSGTPQTAPGIRMVNTFNISRIGN